jgi:hypothetical protein
MTPQDLEDQKRVQFYASSVNAWINSAMEHDKSLLTLSAGGIGLLITLLTTVGLSSSEALVLYIGAILSFLTALVTVLIIYRRNRTYAEQIILSKATIDGPLLGRLDLIALWAFGMGVIFTAAIGIGAAVHSYTYKEVRMTNKSINDFELELNSIRKSLSGLHNLQPQSQADSNIPTGTANTSPSPSGNSGASSTQNQVSNGKGSNDTGSSTKSSAGK